MNRNTLESSIRVSMRIEFVIAVIAIAGLFALDGHSGMAMFFWFQLPGSVLGIIVGESMQELTSLEWLPMLMGVASTLVMQLAIITSIVYLIKIRTGTSQGATAAE